MSLHISSESHSSFPFQRRATSLHTMSHVLCCTKTMLHHSRFLFPAMYIQKQSENLQKRTKGRRGRIVSLINRVQPANTNLAQSSRVTNVFRKKTFFEETGVSIHTVHQMVRLSFSLRQHSRILELNVQPMVPCATELGYFMKRSKRRPFSSFPE